TFLAMPSRASPSPTIRRSSSSSFRRNPRLPAEDRALARQTPVIAAEASRFADHPVAWHDEGDRVASDRGADGACRRRLAEMSGDIGIGRGLAHRNAQERFPHADLEIGADKDNA